MTTRRAVAALALVAAGWGRGALADVDGAALDDPDRPTVGASIDRTEAHVGDRLTVTVTVVGAAGVVSTAALPADLPLGKLELLDRSHADRDLGAGKASRRFVLQVAAYEVGELEVPAIRVEYQAASREGRSAATAPIPLTVRSLRGAEASAGVEPQPLRPPRAVMVPDDRIARALRLGGLAVAAMALLALAWRMRRAMARRRAAARARVAAAPSLPPDQAALARLAELRARGRFSDGDYQPLHFAVSEVVRAFLGARLGWGALELTTTELVDELRRRGVEGPGGRIAALLEACDLVKFARAPSSDIGALALLDEAEAIVRALPPGAPPEASATRETSSTPARAPSTPPEAGAAQEAGATSSPGETPPTSATPEASVPPEASATQEAGAPSPTGSTPPTSATADASAPVAGAGGVTDEPADTRDPEVRGG